MELRQEQDINNQHIDILIELEEHLSQLQCKVSRVWNPWKTCKRYTKFVFRVSPKLLSFFNEKTRKLYIWKLGWRRQYSHVTPSPRRQILPRTALIYLWRPMWRRHRPRYFILATLTPSWRRLTPSPPSVIYSSCLTPSRYYSWRRHLVSSAWKFGT